ncbi:helix-turn-helix domain-containing protein [Ancylobacter sp. FA202]|uniref:helix-turn-helix domain-containing protein n=1 Tax=Ancylobacter sp. FA202 TaxID=1111106 RepID=UPI00037E7F17|nr:helix-turn-helix transcriptional regulator [Ancylobacter sp. FA202]
MFNGLSWPDASGTMFFVPPLSGPICWATLGAGVRVTRDLRGHSGRAAAEVAGVSVATVSRCENGRALSFDGLARLAAYVGQHPHAYTAPALLGRPGSTGNTHCNSLISQEAGHAD